MKRTGARSYHQTLFYSLSSCGAQRLVSFLSLLAISQHQLTVFVVFPLSHAGASSSYVAKRAPPLFLSSCGAQRLVDFLLLLAISQHRFVTLIVFPLSHAGASSSYVAKQSPSLFMIQLRCPATSELPLPPCDKSTSIRYTHRVSFISCGSVQLIRR
ncbi:hypothetical protein ACFFGV_00475 [Pontibacillus salicampi]|uniref:Uncharacterized protein n=1 Tax=Pontibacillus salicampi TaxID=1449801 RepID=A0ABV6LI86_9BACI